jgi:hypothetical protein
MRIVVAFVVAFITAGTASAQPIDVSGDYTGTWGSMSLHQIDERVIGTYGHGRGAIEGVIEDHMIRFAWHEDARAGRGVFAIAGDGSLAGTWGYGDDDRGAGSWLLVRATAREVFAAPLSPALASVRDDLVARVHNALSARPRRSWSFGMRFSWDVAQQNGQTALGVTNFELEIEHQIADRWHAGVTAGLGEVLVIGNSSPDSLLRLRAGAGLRFDLDNVSTWRRTWVGARGGVESIDNGATNGAYGELAFGTDWYPGGTTISVYVAAGLEHLPGQTSMPPLGSAAMISAGSAQTMAPFIGLGLRTLY